MRGGLPPRDGSPERTDHAGRDRDQDHPQDNAEDAVQRRRHQPFDEALRRRYGVRRSFGPKRQPRCQVTAGSEDRRQGTNERVPCPRGVHRADALRGLIATLLICALASTLAIRVALKVDPAAAIGG